MEQNLLKMFSPEVANEVEALIEDLGLGLADTCL